MAYGDFKYLNRKTASDKTLHDKAFNIAKNLKHDFYQRGLASMVYKSFDKKSSDRAAMLANKSTVKSENMSNRGLSEKRHKPIIRKFEKLKLKLAFIGNIWGADLEKCAINKQV